MVSTWVGDHQGSCYEEKQTTSVSLLPRRLYGPKVTLSRLQLDNTQLLFVTLCKRGFCLQSVVRRRQKFPPPTMTWIKGAFTDPQQPVFLLAEQYSYV